MKTEIKIDGMSCGHCVSSVKNALEDVAGVTSVDVNLEQGTASVEHELSDPTPLIVAVEQEGYRAEIAK